MRTNESLLHLMTWLSPAFPVGAFSYSHGLEYAVEAGLVTSGPALCEWVEGILRYGSGQSDAVLFAEAWRAAYEWNFDRLLDLNAYANAFRATKEMSLESESQGQAFVLMANETAPLPVLQQLQDMLDKNNERMAYPIAVATAASEKSIELEAALTAYLHAFASNLISAGVRLVPLGQKAGLKTLSNINAMIPSVVENAVNAPFADIGSAVPMVDWTSAMHETQYTRLFRS